MTSRYGATYLQLNSMLSFFYYFTPKYQILQKFQNDEGSVLQVLVDHRICLSQMQNLKKANEWLLGIYFKRMSSAKSGICYTFHLDVL